MIRYGHQKFYGEKYGNIRRTKGSGKQIGTIGDLYNVLLECWSRETADKKSSGLWMEYDPSYGQSDITAMIVYDLFGGTIHRIHTESGAHYFNIIENHVIDLTSAQHDFVGERLQYEPNEQVDKLFCCKLKETMKRYNLLVRTVSEYLAKKEETN